MGKWCAGHVVVFEDVVAEGKKECHQSRLYIDDVVCVYGPNPVLVESEELVSFDEDNIMLVDDTACVYGPDPVFIESEELVSFDKDDIMLVDDTDCVYGPDPYYMESSNRIDI